MLCDFAENYSPIIQDEIQSAHWTSMVQTALHTTVVYLKLNGTMVFESFCVVSNCLDKRAWSVAAFLRPVINYLKDKYNHLTKVNYFSDGAASQYKNRFHLANLCHHKANYGLDLMWNFFGTSHGKSPCDGVGGATKRLARQKNLQAVNTEPIIQPIELYEWASKNISNIRYFYVSKEEARGEEKRLKNQFETTCAIPNIQKLHCFWPLNSHQLNCSKISGDTEVIIVQVN